MNKKSILIGIIGFAMLIGATQVNAGFFTDLKNIFYPQQTQQTQEQTFAGTYLFPGGGGTGTSTPPTYGKVLVGTSAGVYQLQATSTLGIIASVPEPLTGTRLTYTYASTTAISGINANFSGFITSDSAGANMILTTDNTGAFIASSTPTARAYLATSTTATSTFAGGLVAGNGSLNVLQSGNVGIGTTGPGATLDVRNSSGNISDFYSNSVLRSRLPSNGRQEWYVNSGSAEVGKIAYSTPGGYPGIIFYNGATYDQNRFNLSYYAAANVFGMAFDADGANGLWIKSGGNVGIGTTSPYAKLSVAGRGVFDKDIRADYFTATSTGTASIFTFASTTAISGTNANFTNFYGALTGNVTGNADTATALASNPNDCAGGEFANAIDASGNLACAAPGASSVIGTVSTSTSPTIGQLAYWNTKDAWPEKLDSVATTTLTATGPLALSQPIYVIGPATSALTCTTAASGVAGCLSNTSFDTFNNKADLGSAMTGTFDGNNFRDGAIEAGDLWYGVSSGVIGEISSTTDGTILSLNNGIPSWIATTTFASGLSYASSTNIVSVSSIPDNKLQRVSFSFSYSTSTWSGTTTKSLGPAARNETWNWVKCFTDAGTLNVDFYDGTNRMGPLNASTTIGTTTLSTNNTFNSSEKRLVDIGTPATSPTYIGCTVDKTITGL